MVQSGHLRLHSLLEPSNYVKDAVQNHIEEVHVEKDEKETAANDRGEVKACS